MQHSFIKSPGKANKQRGFTIVELLIVIVVIGILAGIVIVAYNGIQQKAHVAALQSDLKNASDQLEIDNVENGNYPATVAAANGGTGLKASPGTTYQYTASTVAPATYCLTATSSGSSPISFHIATGGVPTEGPCAGNTGTQVASLSCPTGFITVPGSSLYGTNAFCTMKYEVKNVSGVATSVAAGTPWASISQTSAITTAQAACSGCHLITEAEWLTIAQNVLAVPSNWSGGTVGSGYIYSGHNDGAPYNPLAADANDANGYSGETNTGGNQRRTLTLTNGAVIWDLAGNVHEWTDATFAGGTQPGLSGESAYSSKEWNNNALVLGGLATSALPKYGTPAASVWTSAQGIGQLHSNISDTVLRGYLHGGSWGSGPAGGIFELNLYPVPSYSGTDIGFRVSR